MGKLSFNERNTRIKSQSRIVYSQFFSTVCLFQEAQDRCSKLTCRKKGEPPWWLRNGQILHKIKNSTELLFKMNTNHRQKELQDLQLLSQMQKKCLVCHTSAGNHMCWNNKKTHPMNGLTAEFQTSGSVKLEKTNFYLV